MATKKKDLSAFDNSAVGSAADMRFVIVVAEWNPEITEALYEGAFATLRQHGAQARHISRVNVPGSFELTTGARLFAYKKNVNAVICLGCVIQGETRHFEFICSAVANGLTQLTVTTGKPVVFGVLTTNNMAQAKARAGGKHGNKGVEAAVTAIKMAQLTVSKRK